MVEGNWREQQIFCEPTKAALFTAPIVLKESALCLKILVGFYSDLKSEPKIELRTREYFMYHLKEIDLLLIRKSQNPLELNYTENFQMCIVSPESYIELHAGQLQFRWVRSS